jgi:hypothetical protein
LRDEEEDVARDAEVDGAAIALSLTCRRARNICGSSVLRTAMLLSGTTSKQTLVPFCTFGTVSSMPSAPLLARGPEN